MRYAPLPPQDPTQLARYVQDELRRLQEVLNGQTEVLRLAVTYVAPDKPRQGDIRYAAGGTDWDPGGGGGIYYYTGSAWTKL